MAQLGYSSEAGGTRVFYTADETADVAAVLGIAAASLDRVGAECYAELDALVERGYDLLDVFNGNRITTNNPNRDYLGGARVTEAQHADVQAFVRDFSAFQARPCYSGGTATDFEWEDDLIDWGDDGGLTDWEQQLYDELLSQVTGMSTTAEELGVDFAALDELIEELTGGTIEDLDGQVPGFVADEVQRALDTGRLAVRPSIDGTTVALIGGVSLAALGVGVYLWKKGS